MPRLSPLFLIFFLFFASPLGAQSDSFLKARTLLTSGEWEAALELISEVDRDDFDWKMLQAEALRKSGEERKTQHLLEEILDTFGSTIDPVSLLEVHIRLLDVYSHRRKGESATELFSSIFSRSDQIPDHLLGAWYKAVGMYHRYITGNKSGSWEAFQQVVSYYKSQETVDPYLLGSSLRELGNKARTRLGLEEAINYYRQELAVYEEFFSPDHFLISLPHYNLGTVFYELAEPAEALKHFLVTYEIWEQEGPPSTAFQRYLLEAIGDMYWELEDRQQALKFFDLAMDGAPRVNNDEGERLTQKADSLVSAGEYNEAERFYQSALEFRQRELGSKHPLTGGCNNYLARSELRKGNSEQALTLFQQSLGMLNQTNPGSDWNEQVSLDPLSGSEQYLLDALTGKEISLLQLYDLEQDLTYAKVSLQTASTAVNLLDQIRRRPISGESQTFWTQKAFPALEFGVKAAWILYQETGDEQYLNQAFFFSEKSKAFQLMSVAQQQKAQSVSGVSGEILIEEDRLQQGIRDYQLKILQEEQRCGDSRSNLLDLWREKLFQLERAYELFLTNLEAEYPDYFSLKYEVGVSSVSDIQSKLQADQYVVEMFETSEELFLFSISPSSRTWIQVSDSAYRQQLTRWRNILSEPDTFLNLPNAGVQEFALLGHEIYQKLIEPLGISPSITQIFLIPDGSLSGLPLGCMLSQKEALTNLSYRDLPYWFLDHQFLYVPSASMMVRNTSSISREWSGFAPVYDHGNQSYLTKLTHNSDEVLQIGDLMKGQTFIGNRATESAFSRIAGRGGIFHFAAHASIDNAVPGLSALLLEADSLSDGSLYPAEVYGLPLKAGLVVLSACNTGTGKYIQGEGLMSLARAFQFAGSPSLVASLWTVDDESTSELMSVFYQELSEGRSMSASLMEARALFLSSASPTRQHPFFWAGFVGIGQEAKLIDPFPWAWVLVAFVAISLLVFFSRRVFS